MHIARLTPAHRTKAEALFALLSEVFNEECKPASGAHIDKLLANESFWAIAATQGDRIAGGLTAHVLPMTNAGNAELMIYDIAVHAAYQRQGIGQMLINWIRNEASILGIDYVFVLADNHDTDAINFYRKSGGAGSPVTLFAWNKPTQD